MSLSLLFLTSLLPALPAQAPGGEALTLGTWTGEADDDWFGYGVSNGGDIDGDGIDDLLAGALFADPNGMVSAGSAYAYSGADGTLIHRWDGAAAFDQLGFSVADAGDVNGDGHADVLVGAVGADGATYSDSGVVYLYSGLDGSELLRIDGQWTDIDFGFCVDGVGDMDGDGIPDLLVGTPYAHPGARYRAGQVWIYSGADGNQIHEWSGIAPQDSFGRSAACAGDVNGDLIPDVIVGAFGTDPFARFDAGSVFVYSGADGTLLHRFDGENQSDALGFSVASGGDIDGDGLDDLLAGASQMSPQGVFFAGAAYAYSGATGVELFRWDGATTLGQFGYSLDRAGDVNGDGFDDILVGEKNGFYSGVGVRGAGHIFSGADGTTLARWDGTSIGDELGTRVAFGGDQNGDGAYDALLSVGQDGPAGTGQGAVRVVSFHPNLIADTRTASAATGTTVALVLDFTSDAAHQDYRVLFSASGTGPTLHGVPIPLTTDALLQQTAQGSYPFPSSTDLTGTLDATGRATASFQTPVLPAQWIGRTVHLAAVASPAGQLPTSSSVALPLTVTP